jgi:hypothetical protein
MPAQQQREQKQPTPPENYLAGGAAALVAVGAGLTALLLLLRQTRLAAWAQWLACAGVCVATVFFCLEWKHNDLFLNLVQLGIELAFIAALFTSGRFLSHIEPRQE